MLFKAGSKGEKRLLKDFRQPDHLAETRLLALRPTFTDGLPLSFEIYLIKEFICQTPFTSLPTPSQSALHPLMSLSQIFV